MSDVRHFAIQDPKEIDGTPYEVAGKAVRQVQGLLQVAAEALDQAEGMIYNAELSRADDMGLPLPEVQAWRNGPHGTKFRLTVDDLETLAKRLNAIAMAAEYDPRKR